MSNLSPGATSPWGVCCRFSTNFKTVSHFRVGEKCDVNKNEKSVKKSVTRSWRRGQYPQKHCFRVSRKNNFSIFLSAMKPNKNFHKKKGKKHFCPKVTTVDSLPTVVLSKILSVASVLGEGVKKKIPYRVFWGAPFGRLTRPSRRSFGRGVNAGPWG
jgi:hypothetical protein